MREKLKIMLVDEDPGRSIILRQALSDAGYEVISMTHRGQGLLRAVELNQPDVIIVDMASPDRDTLECMHIINENQPRPVVMFSDNDDSQVIESAVKAGVSAYIVDGFNQKRVKPILDVAIARFREFQALRSELNKTRNTLAERKIIDKAKGVIMQQRGISEEKAYRLLRDMAMQHNKKLVDIAKQVIEMANLLGM